MKYVVVLLSLVASLAGCAYRPAPLSGLEFEALHWPHPLPSTQWSPVTDRFGDTTRTRWTRLGDSLDLSIRRSRDLAGPNLFRREADVREQQAPLLAFTSTVLRDGLVNGYRACLWESVSTLPGSGSRTVLHLYVQGNDAAYAIERRWESSPVPATERQQWIDFLLAVSVCDPRTPDHPCPQDGAPAHR